MNDVSIFSEMTALSQKHGAINLGQGFPDFNPPDLLLETVKIHLGNASHQYAPMAGVLELRQALSQKMWKCHQAVIDADREITITCGATQAIFTAIQSIVRPGDEVIIIEPAYDSYAPTIKLCGGQVVAVEMEPPFVQWPWEKLAAHVNHKTKMVIINSPHNPTGKIMTAKDHDALSDIIQDKDIVVVSDEVYEHIIFDGHSHESILRHARLKSKSMAVFSFGKTFHSTGWKIGYCVANPLLMQRFRQVHQWTVFSVNSFLQTALAEYLIEEKNYNYLSTFYQAKRDLFRSFFALIKLELLPAEATFFQMVDYSAVSDLDDLDFAKKMTIDHGLTSIPLSPFYSRKVKYPLIRFCFAKKQETLMAAGSKLKKF